MYPLFDPTPKRCNTWIRLTRDTERVSLESGLLRLVGTLLHRLIAAHRDFDADDLINYVVSNSLAWEFPDVLEESDSDRVSAARKWAQQIASLDSAILSLLGDRYHDTTDIVGAIDEMLSSSLWDRHIRRRKTATQALLDSTLKARAQTIWSTTTPNQRQGYFFAGIGLVAGRQLDEIADEANRLIVDANVAISRGSQEAAIDEITALAEMLLLIEPFSLKDLPPNWREISDGG